MSVTHMILEAAQRCVAELDALSQSNPVFLTAPEKAEALKACLVLETRARALRLRLMLEADDVAELNGSRDITTWLASVGHVNRAEAARDLHLARDLEHLPFLAEAIAAGQVTIDQARVIATALSRLPEEIDDDLAGEAERHLVHQAAAFGPTELRHLGEKILEVIAPEIHDQLEAARLARSEENARQQQRLTLTARSDGLTQISGRLPDAVAIRLATYLHALTNPRREDTSALFTQPEGLTRAPYPHRAAEAFGQLLELWDPTRLPIHGGDATTVMVTMTLDQLRGDLATAGLLDATDSEGETRITAHEARRLACNASIVPVVLGGDSQVLDLGRGARLFSRHQRKTLLLRDQTCRAEGCSIPGTWAEAHHWTPWSRGGPTDLTNAVLLCSHHHHLAHQPRWAAERLTNGDVRFALRT